MIQAPLALAFTAGLVATINPCGFAMLPAYLSYFLGLDDDGDQSGRATMARALTVGGVVTLGFLVVFGTAGLALTFGLRAIIDVLPWAAIVVGVLIGLLGVAMLFGYRPSTQLPSITRGKQRGGYSGVFVFGVSYAIASLSCTLPVFLTVVAGGITGTDPLSAVVTVLVYGAGMAVVLLAVTVLVALGRQTVVRWLAKASRHVERVAGAILLLAGGYIVFFWATNLGSDIGDVSGPVRFVEGISSTLTQLVNDQPVWSAVTAGTLVTAALVYVGWSHWVSGDRDRADTQHSGTATRKEPT